MIRCWHNFGKWEGEEPFFGNSWFASWVFKWVQPKEEENTRLGSNTILFAYQLRGLAQVNPHPKKKKRAKKKKKSTRVKMNK